MKPIVLLALLACTACSDPSIDQVDPLAKFRPANAEPMRAPTFDEAVVGIDGGLASRALSGDVESSTRILADISRLYGHNLNADQSRRQYFWLEIDAQNGSLSSIFELASHSESTIPFYCQRTKFWAAAARDRFPEYETGLWELSRGDSHAVIERTIKLRKEDIASALERMCEIP